MDKEKIKGAEKEFLTRHVAVTMLAAGLVAFFSVIMVFTKPLDPIKRAIGDFSFTDVYYEIQNETGDPQECPFITIVDLTKLTNRSDIAKTLRDIESCEPKVIGLDCVFDNEGENYEANAELIDVAEQHKNIVFALKYLDYENDSVGYTTEIHSFFHEVVDLTEGTVNMPRKQYDSVKRNVPMGEKLNGKWQASFPVQVSSLYADRDMANGRTKDLSINYSPTRFAKLNPEEVLKHPELIRDRIVLFGCLYEDADFHWTPVGKIAGIELLAYSIQNIILNKEIKEVPQVLFWIISFAIVLMVQTLQWYYIRKTTASKNLFVRYIVGSSYVLGILTFLFTAIFMGASFLVFNMYDISFNLAWALSVVAFLGTSRSMYEALKNYIVGRREKIKSLKV